MKRIQLITALLLIAPLQSFAAETDENRLVGMVENLDVTLDRSALQALEIADEWKNSSPPPARGHEGAVVYNYGEALPTIVCAPLFPCNLVLQQGETVRQVDLGDTVRWKVVPSVFNSSVGETTSLIIKPTDRDLETALIVSTDKRIYTIRLVSTSGEWMPRVAFAYPETVNEAWDRYYLDQQREVAETVLPDGNHVENLDFNYQISGDSPPWRPVRVYTDGAKTYIQFPDSLDNITSPALALLGDGASVTADNQLIVNYRENGDRYIVDRVIGKAALVSGNGSEASKIVITRVGD